MVWLCALNGTNWPALTEVVELFEGPGVGLGRAGRQHVLGEELAGVGLGYKRERLGGGGYFAGNVARRVRAFCDGEEGLAGDAVEDVDEALLGVLGYGIDVVAVALDGEENGGAGKSRSQMS